jgi:hypothetical protein
MKHDIHTPIDIVALEREARKLRAEMFAKALRDLGARLRGRAPKLATPAASHAA